MAKPKTINANNNCNLIQESLSARFDGESSLLDDATVKQHLISCKECTEFKSGLSRFKSLWQDNNLNEANHTDALWQQCLTKIDEHQQHDATVPEELKPQRITNNWKAFALAASLVLCVLAVGNLLLDQPDDVNQLVVETVRDFETFRISGELLDINTNSTKEVVQWASNKIEFDLPELVNPPSGFTIAGVRLCSFFNRRLAFVHYEKDSSILSLYVMKADGIDLHGNGVFKTGTTANGLTTVAWTQDDLAYVIVSELPESETMHFASRT